MTIAIEVLVGIIAAVLGLFGIEHSKRKDAEAKLITAESDTKDATLAAKQAAVGDNIKAETTKTEAEKAKKPTPAEMEQFLKDL